MASINGKSTSKELAELSKTIVVSKLYTVEIEYANGGYMAEINIIDDNLE